MIRPILGLLLGSFLAFPVFAQDTLRIATEGAYPPFNVIDSSGELKGFDVDIANALCAEMGADCELVTQSWDGIIPGLIAGRYDAIIASMSITPERQEAVTFSEPYYSNKLQFIAPKESDFGPGDAADAVIGAQRATIAAQWLEDNVPEAERRVYDTQENAYLDLESGRLDAVLADVYVSYEWLESDEGAAYEFKGDPVYDDDKIAVAVRKGNDELAERFSDAIEAIRADGTYQAINADYFPFDIY
ncbi:ABC transporter substrate-binding protein [Spiribacter vilamensis]|uniref:Amino acid ABC transporter substrate-binding protein (PAAT family) n=1 Tax=Spiribacter vilamensis TaxID=531306 RepID=A0A4Q8CYR9_9GAMM|nr:ABC transporter substrate-binding protein [Spiribacter vilamensis]RZU98092.1 amino acid ABC transporter substrate-binding protein (PAAT family) [Spiribacter vilamensis]TVO61006.1 transporter substrate-binding domain-containing protein [Spiribacter vilamensis]